MRHTNRIVIVLLSLLLAACGPFHARYTDEEAVAAILAADGSGSGLDADLLDGKDSSAFMSATEDKWVNETGDTMTGPLNVQNDVTANNYFYGSPLRGHKGVAGTAFIATGTDGTVWVADQNGYGYLRAAPWVPSQGIRLCDNSCLARVTALSDAVELRAAIDLPEKSKVTGFTCYWYDRSNTPRASYNFKLMRKQWFQNDATAMATVSGSTNDYAAASAVRYTTTNAITDPVINTLNSSYYIAGRWHATDGLGDAVRFYGCLVDYEVTQVGPP